jgi:hypothetical protein
MTTSAPPACAWSLRRRRGTTSSGPVAPAKTTRAPQLAAHRRSAQHRREHNPTAQTCRLRALLFPADCGRGLTTGGVGGCPVASGARVRCSVGRQRRRGRVGATRPPYGGCRSAHVLGGLGPDCRSWLGDRGLRIGCDDRERSRGCSGAVRRRAGLNPAAVRGTTRNVPRSQTVNALAGRVRVCARRTALDPTCGSRHYRSGRFSGHDSWDADSSCRQVGDW